MNKILVLFVALLLVGCAVGNKYDYQSKMIALPIKPSEEQKILILSVEDLRPYVLNGEKEANFVGIQRGGYGNPFDVTTSSGKSMIQDMSAAIAQAVTNVGYYVINAQGHHDNVSLVKFAIKSGAIRIIALKVYEWKSDVYTGITLHCDLRLSVFDTKGELLAKNIMKFVKEIGGAQLGEARNSQVMVDEFAKRIGYLFNKKDVRSALQ